MLLILVFAVIACFSIFLIIGLLTGSIALFITGLITLQVKTIIDLWLLEAGSKVLKEKYRLLDVLITELLQIPYTLILQPISLITKFNWRGRRL